MRCETDFGAAFHCVEHTHCNTCYTLLDEREPESMHMYTCTDCSLPFFPVNDPMDPIERHELEWEMRNYRGAT